MYTRKLLKELSNLDTTNLSDFEAYDPFSDPDKSFKSAPATYKFLLSLNEFMSGLAKVAAKKQSGYAYLVESGLILPVLEKSIARSRCSYDELIELNQKFNKIADALANNESLNCNIEQSNLVNFLGPFGAVLKKKGEAVDAEFELRSKLIQSYKQEQVEAIQHELESKDVNTLNCIGSNFQFSSIEDVVKDAPGEGIEKLKQTNARFNSLVQKYRAAEEAEKCLTTPTNESKSKQLENFNKTVQAKQNIFTQGKDKTGAFIVKVALSALLAATGVGAIAVAALWCTVWHRDRTGHKIVDEAKNKARIAPTV